MAGEALKGTRSPGIMLTALVTVGFVARLGLFAVYQPVVMADTGSYARFAEQILSWDFFAYDGERTPVFPALLAVSALDYRLTWAVHGLLGILASVLLFQLAWQASQSRALAFVVGLSPTVVLNQVFFEANMVAESVTSALAIGTAYVAIRMVAEEGKRWWRPGLLGVLIGLAVLARPGYVVLVPVYTVLSALLLPRVRLRTALIVFLSASVLVLGWAAVNRAAVGQFGLSTRMGYGLMHHAGAFIEGAGPRYATVREIYLRYRPQRVAETGHQMGTIFIAKPEIQRATGLSDQELSRELTALAFDLFRRHPWRYAQSVFGAWYSYWSVPIYWRLELISLPAVATALGALWQLEHPLMRGTNLVFFLGGISLLAYAGSRALRGEGGDFRGDRELTALLVLAAVVLSFSVFQGLFEYADNGRYAIPTQPLVLAFVVLGAARLVARRGAAGRWLTGTTRAPHEAALERGPP